MALQLDDIMAEEMTNLREMMNRRLVIVVIVIINASFLPTH